MNSIIKNYSTNRFSWHKISDFDEETKEKLRAETTTKSSIEIIQSNELLTEQLPQAKKTMSAFSLPKGKQVKKFYIVFTQMLLLLLRIDDCQMRTEK